jgi:Zn-dependent metalloprotease
MHVHDGGCFIVPPHILDQLARSGSEEQRRRALRSLVLTEQLRGARGALTGNVLPARVPGEKRRTVFDVEHGLDLPGKLARGEESPAAGDDAVNEAFEGAGAVYDFFKAVYKRDSIDDAGMRIDSSVHYDVDFDNAFWDGQQMVYGDGDGRIFASFTTCIDVIAHELAHGVTQHEAGLVYRAQPGALNESFSDVFGSLVKQWSARPQKTAANADWLIGAGLLLVGKALRSMSAPGTAYKNTPIGDDPQPAHMSNYYAGNADNQGVHINSGIPNRAFYLAAVSLGGYAWEKAGLIWYRTLGRLRPTAQFADAARSTISVASELYGSSSPEAAAVQDAWTQVGVLPQVVAVQVPVMPAGPPIQPQATP